MKGVKKFLVISLCLLCWHCSCDNEVNDEIPGKRPSDEVEFLHRPQIKVQSTDHPHENVNIKPDKTIKTEQSDSPMLENVHNLEEKVILNHPDVKSSKFSEQIRKTRRRDTPIGPINKRKLKDSISDKEDIKIETENILKSKADELEASQPITATADHTEAEAAEKKSDLKEATSAPSDETRGSPAASPEAASEVSSDNSLPSAESVNTQEMPDQAQHAHSETMPSFDEWKKMMLAEQEKGGHKVPSLSPPGKKIASQKRRRNYSSYECGAKIVASNAEAEGTSRILNERVDEYMLNPCKAKIWFVIELCETVQASQIELANFELFSSCPKDFAVSSSDNFPTRDWVPLGTFTAAEQRVLQSFQLKSEGFSKFIKVELLSHYGKEHYCPLNVVRVFGTSMVDEYEELEKMSDDHSVPDDELDRLDIPIEDKSSSNIFGSATDAVYNIVKKAAQVLGQQTIDESVEKVLDQNASETEHCKLLDESCVQKNKSDTESAISDVISSSTLQHSLYHHLRHCDQCVTASRHSYYSVSLPQCRFFQAALGPVVYKNICDWYKDHLLVTLQKAPIIDVVQNDSQSAQKPPSPPPAVISVIIDNESSSETLPTYSDMGSPKPTVEEAVSRETSQLPASTKSVETATVVDKMTQPAIQPTKTVQISEEGLYVDLTGTLKTELPCESDFTDTVIGKRPDDEKILLPSVEKISAKVNDTFTSTVTIPSDQVTASVDSNITKKNDSEEKVDIIYDENLALEMEAVTDANVLEPGTREYTVDMKTGEIKLDTRDATMRIDPVVVGSTTFAQKESVFVRMNNRIKALELNMSLSSQYLQELSQRYRRQMEEMQRAFNRTIGTLNDTARKAAERDLKQQEVIGNLQSQVSNLTEAVDKMMERHIFLMVAEAIAMITIMSLCVRRISSVPHQSQLLTPAESISRPSRSDKKRRNSTSSCSPPSTKRVKKRSSSDEALLSGELLIVEPCLPVIVQPPPKIKKKHKKKKQMQRSASNPTMSPMKESASATNIKEKAKSDATCAAGILFSYSDACVAADRFCENCDTLNATNCSSTRSHSSEKRINSVPLKNLTNGGVAHEQFCSELMGKERYKFSFRKFLRLQKRESI